MKFDVLTLFPALFSPFMEESIVGRAVKGGLAEIRITDIRAFARGRHKIADDRPFGGGSGMVMKAGPISRGLESIPRVSEYSKVVLLTPQGSPFKQATAWKLSQQDQLILICGRYEGVDERVRAQFVDLELSLGDYVISGGELAAMVIMDAIIRLIPGVLGGEDSNKEDSFEEGLLEYPQYTRPRVYRGEEVPSVLLSGDHEKIRRWRRAQSLKRTLERRPDLLEKASLTKEDIALLAELDRDREH
jgi:tRNA (guanine37-N1)-methyltransferase